MIDFITLFWILYVILITSCGVFAYYYAKTSHEVREYFSNQYVKDLIQVGKDIQRIEDIKLIIEKEYTISNN